VVQATAPLVEHATALRARLAAAAEGFEGVESVFA
jgi:hypothetical protein